MRAQLKHHKSNLPVWLQYSLMVVAGLGSFYAALQWGPDAMPTDGGVELSKASTSVNARHSEVSSHAMPHIAEAGFAAMPSGASTSPLRMDAGILQNPFGALNLLATVELLSMPVPVNAPEVKVVRTPKRVEVVPPTPAMVLAPASPPAPAAEPVAPPLPFRVLGSIQGQRIGDGAPLVFLSDRGNNTLAVRSGDEIDRTYRVERITADRVEFTYLPLKTVQSLTISH